MFLEDVLILSAVACNGLCAICLSPCLLFKRNSTKCWAGCWSPCWLHRRYSENTVIYAVRLVASPPCCFWNNEPQTTKKTKKIKNIYIKVILKTEINNIFEASHLTGIQTSASFTALFQMATVSMLEICLSEQNKSHCAVYVMHLWISFFCLCAADINKY